MKKEMESGKNTRATLGYEVKMYLVNYDKKLNAIYIQLNNDMTNKDIHDALKEIRRIIRSELSLRCTLIINMEGVELETIASHIKEFKKVQKLLAIRQVEKLMRIGERKVSVSYTHLTLPTKVSV